MGLECGIIAKITVTGVNELYNKLNKLAASEATNAMKAGVYEGAGAAADALKAEIASLSAEKGSWPFYKKTIVGLSETQKQGLIDGVGIASIEDKNGVINTKVGFNGYNDHVTEHYPKGQPNALVARSLESGSSIGTKHPFVRPTASKARKTITQKMADKVKKEIEKAMK